MKTIKEAQQYIIDNIKVDDQKYNLFLEDGYYGQKIEARMNNWTSKEQLLKHENWLVLAGTNNLRRYLSRDTNRIEISGIDGIVDSIKIVIANELERVILETIPAAAPKRTKIYKELMDVYHCHRRDETFLNETLPLVEYYMKVLSEDKEARKVHFKNIHTLLTILGRKYKNGNSRIG